MSNEQDDQLPESIFSGSEPPEEGAQVLDDEAGETTAKPSVAVEVDEHGHVSATAELEDGENPYDHSAEQAAMDGAREKAGVNPPDLPETPNIPAQNPAVMADPNAEVRREVEARFQAEFGQLNVEVTREEREEFVRAALHDLEMRFHIPIEAVDVLVDVVTPPDAFTTMASAMANQWGKDGHISADSDMEWLLTFQQMHVWYQVRAVDGNPTPWSDFFQGEPPTMAGIRKHLSDPANLDAVVQMPPIRWRMLLEAVRVAELKYKLCLQNWHDRTFFTTAGTA